MAKFHAQTTWAPATRGLVFENVVFARDGWWGEIPDATEIARNVRVIETFNGTKRYDLYFSPQGYFLHGHGRSDDLRVEDFIEFIPLDTNTWDALGIPMEEPYIMAWARRSPVRGLANVKLRRGARDMRFYVDNDVSAFFKSFVDTDVEMLVRQYNRWIPWTPETNPQPAFTGSMEPIRRRLEHPEGRIWRLEEIFEVLKEEGVRLEPGWTFQINRFGPVAELYTDHLEEDAVAPYTAYLEGYRMLEGDFEVNGKFGAIYACPGKLGLFAPNFSISNLFFTDKARRATTSIKMMPGLWGDKPTRVWDTTDEEVTFP